MKIREHKLLLYRLANDILYELLDARDILQYMLVRLPKLALDENIREKPLAHRQRFGILLRPLRVWIALRAAPGARPAACRRAIRIEFIEHAQVDAPTGLVRDGEFAIEDETGDGDLDGQRHEQWRGVVDP
jgi:hypothetical protein